MMTSDPPNTTVMTEEESETCLSVTYFEEKEKFQFKLNTLCQGITNNVVWDSEHEQELLWLTLTAS
jgi:hypothetical protein